jgi:deoxyribodipyrimidine photo-lyase
MSSMPSETIASGKARPHTALLWLRRDLRLADNPALVHALANAEQVVAVYIHAPQEEGAWAPGAASRWWLHHSLQALQAQFAQRQGRLLLREGDSTACLEQLIDETGATLVCWNRLYEPALTARDTDIKARLRARGVDVESFNAAMLFEPWTVRNQQGQPFKVFTPFWRRCATELAHLPLPLAEPASLRQTDNTLPAKPLSGLALLPGIAWDAGLRQSWQPGEAGAHARLQCFVDDAARDYKTGRDRPDRQGTSRLSPHLHFGEIGPRQLQAQLGVQDVNAEAYARELGWREFAIHLMYHFPQTTEQSMDVRFERFAWRVDATALKRAWQRGRTGIPLVDAGMRELWHTGFMHNRVRMVVASFLTKNLLVHWLEGARWFWDTLVDADLANNTLGWQWTAGCGADAAPFFRVFNPTLQAERFDPDSAYLRKWLPELARMPEKWIAKPWQAPVAVLRQAGVELGATYPHPIVDLGTSREAALGAYAAMKSG